MNELENGNDNNQELDRQIELAMDKIIEETIGHIQVSDVPPIDDEKKLKDKVKDKTKEKLLKIKQSLKAAKAKIKPKVKTEPEATETPVAPPVPEVVAPAASVEPVESVTAAEPVAPAEPVTVPAEPVAAAESPVGDDEQPPKSYKKLVAALVAVALVAGLGTYGGFAYYYRDKFMPGTIINGINCNKLTVSAAEQKIREKVENYTLDINFREDKKQDIAGADISYSYVPDDSVTKLMQKQNSMGWIVGLVKSQNVEASEDISYDEEQLQQQYNALECVQESAQVAPTDAFVNYQNGQFEIVPEVEGSTIDREILITEVKAAIAQSQTQVSVEEAGAYLQPQVRVDNEVLAAEQAELNALVNASVTYQLQNCEEVLDGNILKDWLLIDEEGNYVKDEETFNAGMADYVAGLAERNDTVGNERPFHTTSGRDITVSGGSYGWKIDQKEELALLAENLANHEQIAREPVYASVEVSAENSGFGDTYIEINLTDQELYYYQNGTVIVQSSFVSGRMTSSRYTPPGIFNLYYKSRDKVLRGTQRADGSYEYESPVKFWMPFNRGIGLHDASWRSTFGGNIYQYKGSHGCINMPYEKAKAVYESITTEVPIICFYTDGYSMN